MNCFALIKCRPYLYIDCYLPSVCNFFPPPLILSPLSFLNGGIPLCGSSVWVSSHCPPRKELWVGAQLADPIVKQYTAG